LKNTIALLASIEEKNQPPVLVLSSGAWQKTHEKYNLQPILFAISKKLGNM
jgi:hypothetical protein